MQFFLAVFYVLLGAILATAYCYLAGWDPNGFGMGMTFGPFLLFVWIIVAAICNVIVVNRHGSRFYFNWRAAFFKEASDRTSGKRLVFWLYTSWCLLPIILRGVSALVEVAGYKALSSILYEHRYLSMYYVLMGSIVLLTLFGLATNAWESMKNKWVRVVHR